MNYGLSKVMINWQKIIEQKLPEDISPNRHWSSLHHLALKHNSVELLVSLHLFVINKPQARRFKLIIFPPAGGTRVGVEAGGGAADAGAESSCPSASARKSNSSSSGWSLSESLPESCSYNEARCGGGCLVLC